MGCVWSWFSRSVILLAVLEMPAISMGPAGLRLPVECGVAEARGSGAAVHVRGYYRKDGTYVQPYVRSAPDGNFYNNWSTKGIVNPYTGQPGTRVTPPRPSLSSISHPLDDSSNPRNSAEYLRSSGPDLFDSRSVTARRPDGRALVISLQQALQLANENPGPIDGVLGVRTARAFASFARANGTEDLPVEATLAKLSEYLSSTQVTRPSDTEGSGEPLPADDVPPPALGPRAGGVDFGSTALDVSAALGDPPRVVRLKEETEWRYDNSTVTFRGGRVVSWVGADGLSLLAPESAAHAVTMPIPDVNESSLPAPAPFAVGSTAVSVLAAQGWPDRVTHGDGVIFWWYGQSRVAFGEARVVSWQQVNVPLNSR